MGTSWLFTAPATTGTGDAAGGAAVAFSKPGASKKYRAAAASATIGKATRTMVFRFICLAPAREIGQQPGPAEVPVEESCLVCLVVTPSGNVPVTGHGGVAVIDGE